MDNSKNGKCHYWVLSLLATIALAIGILLIIWGCFSNKNDPGNIGALLAINIGGIVCLGSGYTLLSELWLKKDFAKQLRASIDQRLEQTALNNSIIELGLNSITVFERTRLWARMDKSDSVLMVAMRNNGFLKTYCDGILKKILDDNTKFTFLLLDPDSSVISSLEKKFSDIDEDGLRNSIRSTIDIFIKESIYNKLPPEKQNNLTLRTFDGIPVYSAYIFDDEELWYIPFHFRYNYKPIPMFVFKGREHIIESQLYKDITELQSDGLSKEAQFENV